MSLRRPIRSSLTSIWCSKVTATSRAGACEMAESVRKGTAAPVQPRAWSAVRTRGSRRNGRRHGPDRRCGRHRPRHPAARSPWSPPAFSRSSSAQPRLGAPELDGRAAGVDLGTGRRTRPCRRPRRGSAPARARHGNGSRSGPGIAAMPRAWISWAPACVVAISASGPMTRIRSPPTAMAASSITRRSGSMVTAVTWRMRRSVMRASLSGGQGPGLSDQDSAFARRAPPAVQDSRATCMYSRGPVRPSARGLPSRSLDQRAAVASDDTTALDDQLAGADVRRRRVRPPRPRPAPGRRHSLRPVRSPAAPSPALPRGVQHQSACSTIRIGAEVVAQGPAASRAPACRRCHRVPRCHGCRPSPRKA